MTILRGTHLHFLPLLGVILNIPPPPPRRRGRGGKGSVLNVKLWTVFWILIWIRIWIQGSSGSGSGFGSRGLKKGQKC